MPVTCSHSYPLCRHGKCDMECGELTCEPSLEHEYHCNCTSLGCQRRPCTGAYCGCMGCKRAYSDASGGPE